MGSLRLEYSQRYVKVSSIILILSAFFLALILLDLGKTSFIHNIEYNPEGGFALEGTFFVSTDYWKNIHSINGEYLGKDSAGAFIGRHLFHIEFYLFIGNNNSMIKPYSSNSGTQDLILTTISIYQMNKDISGEGVWLNSESKIISTQNDKSRYEMVADGPEGFQYNNLNEYEFAIVFGDHGLNLEFNGDQNGYLFVDDNANVTMKSSFQCANIDIYSGTSYVDDKYMNRFVVTDFYSKTAELSLEFNSFFLIKSLNELSEVDLDISLESKWTTNHLWHIWEYQVLKTTIPVQFSY